LIYLAAHSLAGKDPIAAEGFVDRALNVATKGAVAGRALTVKGNIALANGLIGVAELNYLQALAQDPPESTEAALTMETYARSLTDQSRTGEAQALQQQAFTIRKAHVAAISAKAYSLDGDVAKVGGGVSAPTLLHRQEPEYSEDARLAKYQGSAMLAITIGPDGQASNLELIKGIGFGLDEKAAEAVTAWKFKPATRDGQPVAVHATIEVNFKLL
jgi:TonB family protein